MNIIVKIHTLNHVEKTNFKITLKQHNLYKRTIIIKTDVF